MTTEPIPMVLHCPECRTRHIDEGDFATKPRQRGVGSDAGGDVSVMYDVATGRFGIVTIDRDSIDDARRWAKEAMGLGPRTVSRHVESRQPCLRCDSRPCCCSEG